MLLSFVCGGELSRHNVNSLKCQLWESFIFLQLPCQRIVLKWRCRSWPDGESLRTSLWQVLPLLEETHMRGDSAMWKLTWTVLLGEQADVQSRCHLWRGFFLTQAEADREWLTTVTLEKTLHWMSLLLLPEHYATVALNFKDMALQTELQVECKGVPVSHEDSTRQCWKQQYFEEIHILLQQSQASMEWYQHCSFVRALLFILC